MAILITLSSLQINRKREQALEFAKILYLFKRLSADRPIERARASGEIELFESFNETQS